MSDIVECCASMTAHNCARSAAASARRFSSLAFDFSTSHHTSPPATANTNASPTNSDAACSAASSLIDAFASARFVSCLAFRPAAPLAASALSSRKMNALRRLAARAASMAHARSDGESEIAIFNRFASGLDAVLTTSENAFM